MYIIFDFLFKLFPYISQTLTYLSCYKKPYINNSFENSLMLLILRKFILPFKTIYGSCISVFMIINKCLPSDLLNFFVKQVINIIRKSVLIFWRIIFVHKLYEMAIISFFKFFLDFFQVFTEKFNQTTFV